MIKLNLPQYPAKVIKQGDEYRIFDDIRRQYVSLTPEEWVRQHFVHFLVDHKGYPKGLMANEITIKLNGMNRRCDSVVYDRNLQPRLIIEFKAPHVAITQKVFDQIFRYNLVLQVDHLIVSNGLQHYCCRIDRSSGTYQFIKDVPTYESLTSGQ